MLEMWRRGAGLEPAVAEASVERFDSLDIDGRLLTAMRAWYIDYLVGAPEDMVPVADLTEYARVTATEAPDEWRLRLSCPTARITGVELEGFGAARILNPDCAEHRDAIGRLENKFVRRGCRVAAIHRPGTDHALITVSSDSAPVIKEVRGVAVTDDETFTVDERVLADIPRLAMKTLYPEQ